MPILKVKNPDGSWSDIPALIGPKGSKGDTGEPGDSKVAYAICDTAAATAAKVAAISGNDSWTLQVGSIVMVYFSISNTAKNVTLNVNGTGAYPIWYNNAEYTSTGTAYTGYAKRVIEYMFNGTHWVWMGASYDSNTTYKNVSLGHGYATCSTAAAITAKVGTLASYALTLGGIVAVKFTYAVPANATLNINGKGAKNMFYRGAKITAGVIGAGDIATFIYDGTQYQLLTVDRADRGADGTSVTVESVSESTVDGGSNVVTFSDGKTVTIKNGSKGSTGATGAQGPKGDKGDPGIVGPMGEPGPAGSDGRTPVRGVDYYTEADKTEFSAYIASELAKRGQLKPEFANSIEECTDTTKLYVLPDGMIYAWMLTEKEVDNGPTYTNRLPLAINADKTLYVGDNGEKGYRVGYRVSSSGTEKAATGYDCIGFIPGVAGDTVRIKNVTQLNNTTNPADYAVAYFFTSKFVKTSGAVDLELNTTFSDGVYTFTIPDYANIAYFRVSLVGVSADTIITVNEEITEGGGTEIVKEYAWASTGHAFVPADYEDRIIAVENTATKNTARIVALEKSVESGGADETEAAALERIKVWDKPVYDNAPVTLIDDDGIKPALTAEDRTIEAIYAKYRALRDDPNHPENALYITETNLGLCTTSDLVPGFGGKDVLRFDFCEPSGLTEVDDPSTPKVPDPARETKPKLIFLSGIHKEWAGVYGLYYALEEIANNPKFEDIRRNAHIIVIPCANPFGLIAEYTTTTNGWAAPSNWGAPSHVNANGIAPHNNFGVGYKANQNVIGSYNHSGSEAYSELETQYIDKVMAENSDAIAFVSCHNYNNGGVFGHETIWASSATYHMCNLVYRLVDKLSKTWLKKYGDSLKQSIDSVKTNVSASEYRLGRATMSTSAGTEQQNATKYGILATNLEISDKWVVFSNTQFSSEAMTHGAEVYANFMRTILQAYDHKDKKDYAPNLPWEN